MSFFNNGTIINEHISNANWSKVNHEVTSKISKLSNTSKKDLSDVSEAVDEELMNACKSFETYFVEQVFKEMRKTVPNSEEKNDTYSYFEDFLYKEYANNTTEQGNLGLAQILYESMKRNYQIQ